MPERREIVILAEPDPRLTEVTERLRSDGWRIHHARRAYEAVIALGRSQAEILVVRRDALAVDAEDFLRQVRDLDPSPWVLIEGEGAGLRDEQLHGDIWLPAPLSYEDLRDALEFELRDSGKPAPRDRVAPAAHKRPNRRNVRPGGLGVGLIYRVFDETVFEPGRTRGNRVVMRARRDNQIRAGQPRAGRPAGGRGGKRKRQDASS